MVTTLELLLAPDPESFRKAARPLVDAPEALDAALPEILEETALRHWREDYPQHVPHALLALLGGLEARDLLTGPERNRPVVQALSYVARETHLPRFEPGSVPARGGEEELRTALPDGDFETAYGACRALVEAGRSDSVREILLEDATRDDFNLFHRFIYAQKVFRRLRADPDLPAEALLFPVVHYACRAPRDGRIPSRLEPSAIADADPTAIAEDAFDSAVRLLSATRGFEWVPVAHAATFSEAARDWWLNGKSEARASGPTLAAEFLTELARSTPPPEDPPQAGALAKEPSADLASRVETAIAGRDPETAGAATAALVGRPGARRLLERALLLGCSRIDGGVAFSHDVKVTADAVRLARERSPRDLAAVLPFVAVFLARLPGGTHTADALF